METWWRNLLKYDKRMGEVEMFASRLNYQSTPYIPWGPEPQAMAIDAFTLNWNYSLIDVFPPFNLIAPVMQ